MRISDWSSDVCSSDLEGWRVGTAGLQVQGTDFGVAVRGGMWFQGDGTRPWIDLAADVESTAVTTAKEFWIHYLMPPASLRSAERRVGKACVRTCSSRWSPYP